jgi:hypothetical protein
LEPQHAEVVNPPSIYIVSEELSTLAGGKNSDINVAI